MGLKRTKLLGIQAVSGISTVGILTVGVTQTGGVGIASTTYLRGGDIQHWSQHLYFITLCVSKWCQCVTSYGHTEYRLTRVELASNETFFYEMNYPLVLVDQEKIVVDVMAQTPLEEQVLEVL